MPPLHQVGGPARATLIVVLGPTSSGKSRFAVELAEALGAEIVGADSRQVYRGMDVGTGKVTPAERRLVPHHLLDVVDPDEPFGLADYCDRALGAIAEIRTRGRTPILVGGSAQYVWAIAEGWEVPRVAPNRELRAMLTARAETAGADDLHRELAHIDPEAAAAIHPHNVRRVVRALELAEVTGVAPSSLRRRRTPPASVMIFGLQTSPPELHRRIDERVDAMFRDGLVAEVEELLSRGYDASLPSMSGIGYTQVAQFLHGRLSLDEAIHQTKAATRHFARRQSTWFRASDRRISWRAGDAVTTAINSLKQTIGTSDPDACEEKPR